MCYNAFHSSIECVLSAARVLLRARHAPGAPILANRQPHSDP